MKKILALALALLFPLVAAGDVKITQLPAGSAASSSTDSVFPYVDLTIPAGVTKKLTLADLVNVPALAAPSFCTAKPLTGFVSAPGVLSSADTILSAIDKLDGNVNAISAASVTVGPYGSSPNANGGTITLNTLTLQPASAAFPGGLTTGVQSIAGNKTFTGTLAASNLSGTNTGDITIGTANGLSLVGQALSLGLSSTSTIGALSDTDWDTFNAKQPAGNYLTALTGDVTASGPGSAAATLATVNSDVGSFTYGSFTVNGKGLITAASSGAAPEVPLTFGDGLTRTVNDVDCDIASGSVFGCLASADWTTFNNKQAALPLTTKGDILTYAGGYARFPVCADGEVMIADSGETLGWTCGTPGTSLTFDDTDSIDLTDTAGAITADLNLSADPPDAGYAEGETSIETDGLKVQVPDFVGDAGAGGVAGAVPAPVTGDATKFLRGDGTFASVPAGGVTTITIASANGFAGSSSGGATPALTLSTTITGLLKGNGTAISAAVSGTDYAPATSGTSILYGNGSGGFSNVTVGSGLSFAAGTLSATATAPTAISQPIAQTSHGFSVGELVYCTSTTSCTRSKSDTPATAEVSGLVTTVSSANAFIITLSGYVTGLTGLTADSTYFVSDSVAGAMTLTEPTTVGFVSRPVFRSDSTTSGYFQPLRGVTITASTGGGGSSGLACAIVEVPNTSWATVQNTSYGSFSAVGSFSSNTATSGSTTCSVPGTIIPGVLVSSIAAGKYKVTAIGDFCGVSGNPTAFTIYDGTSNGQANSFYPINAGAAIGCISQVVSYFTYASTQTNITYQLRAKTNGSGNTQIGNMFPELSFIVERMY